MLRPAIPHPCSTAQQPGGRGGKGRKGGRGEKNKRLEKETF